MTIRSVRLGFLLVAMATLSVQAQAQAPKPGPEHARLSVFLGKWNFEGQAQASPYGPAGKQTSADTFEWLPGSFFMSHHWDVRQGGVDIKGMEILGYDSRGKTYTSRFFDNFGNSGSVKGSVEGNTWTWTAESEVGGKPLKERGTNVVTGDVITSKWEYSTDGSTWKPNFEVKGTRAK